MVVFHANSSFSQTPTEITNYHAPPLMHFSTPIDFSGSYSAGSFHGGGSINITPGGHTETGSITYSGPHVGIDATVTHSCQTGGGCTTGGVIGGHIKFGS
jgi:hypothetical protein